MSKSNGQADFRVEDKRGKADLEHELPPAEPGDGFEEKSPRAAEQKTVAAVENVQEAEAKKLREERDNLFDRLARLQAEFDNYRKRSAKENADFREYAVADAARNLLPVIDNLALALKNSSARPEEFHKGVELIYKQLQDALQKLNIQRIPAQGQAFDPRVHEAIEMVESDEVPDHHVLEELQPGYKIKDRLLRPAMVRVAKKAG
ncbi:MAG TPA: nucleotide exchange factor GrpE [Candidatus Angelobacter sp.]|nr:nucleotide exchange factor GrpE [Candidatus Angelobacter sp.]